MVERKWMSGKSERNWQLAKVRRAKGLSEAEEHFPREAGYAHFVSSDGWPDERVEIRVYEKRIDRRFRSGTRLVHVATFGPYLEDVVELHVKGLPF